MSVMRLELDMTRSFQNGQCWPCTLVNLLKTPYIERKCDLCMRTIKTTMIINVNKHFNVDVHTYLYIYLEGFKLTTLSRKPNDIGLVFYI